jgi:hypothetical protein
MTEKVKNQLNELGKIANQVSDLVNNGKPFGNTEKQTLFLAYFDIDVEHLRSLHLLISNDNIGSTSALVRTFYETFFRALWVNAFATPEQLEKIRNNDFNFMRDEGSMGSKIERLDSHYTDTKFFKNLKDGVWGIMSDYTHSGSYQLSRRWTDGELVPNYKENEILEIIIEVTKTYLLFANILFKIHNYKEEEDKVLDILIEYKKNTNPILEVIYE